MNYSKLTKSQLLEIIKSKNFMAEDSAKMSSPDKVVEEVRKNIVKWTQENFIVLALNGANRIIASDMIALGTANQCLASPRDIFHFAIKHLATGIIIAHNHPSGSTEPSREDAELTKRIIEAGKIMGIPLVDSVIVTTEDFFSMKESLLLNWE